MSSSPLQQTLVCFVLWSVSSTLDSACTLDMGGCDKYCSLQWLKWRLSKFLSSEPEGCIFK
jgi:hypothetical protein